MTIYIFLLFCSATSSSTVSHFGKKSSINISPSSSRLHCQPVPFTFTLSDLIPFNPFDPPTILLENLIPSFRFLISEADKSPTEPAFLPWTHLIRNFASTVWVNSQTRKFAVMACYTFELPTGRQNRSNIRIDRQGLSHKMKVIAPQFPWKQGVKHKFTG